MSRLACLLLLIMLCSQSPAAPVAGQRIPEKVGIDQKFDSQVPLDAVFQDEQGNPVRLGELIDGTQPIVLNLMYIECPRLCRMTTHGLLGTLRALQLTAGQDFRILTVSFDPRETPQLAAAAKKTALQIYDRPSAEEGWRFLTGSQESIDALTEAVGFRVAYDEQLGQYARAGLIVLTPEGRVARYLNGVEFPARDVRLALVEASQGEIGTPVDQVLLLCYPYNPQNGKYGWAVDRAVKVLGIGTVILLGGSIVLMLRRERQQADRDQGFPTADDELS